MQLGERITVRSLVVAVIGWLKSNSCGIIVVVVVDVLSSRTLRVIHKMLLLLLFLHDENISDENTPPASGCHFRDD